MSHKSKLSLFTWASLAACLIAPLAAEPLPSLRILPLGDSITKGSGSTNFTGYREPLRRKLTENGTDTPGFDVDMVGTLHDGSMIDNDHEGHSGKFLADIKGYYDKSIQALPNVVLLNAGANNMDKNVDLDTAPQIIQSIIDGLFHHAPETVVLVAPVLWANNATDEGKNMQKNTRKFNSELEAFVKKRQDSGAHILSVPIDIHSASELHDYKHPNDIGYGKMAEAWFNAIIESNKRGWLHAPIDVKSRKLEGVGLGWNANEKGKGDEGNDSKGNDNKGSADKSSEANNPSDATDGKDNEKSAATTPYFRQPGWIVALLGHIMISWPL